MTQYVKPHIPRVIVTTPEPSPLGLTPSIFTRISVDGVEWAITDYHIEGNVDGYQKVTLSFLADITVERPDR